MENIDQDGKILAKFKKFCDTSNSYLANTLKRCSDDLSLMAGRVFDEEDRKIRGNNLAEIAFNYLLPYKNQIVNQYRANPFGITVTDRKEGQNLGESMQGLIRGIERKSNAKQAYIKAIDDQVTCGRGYVAVTTDYMSETCGFEQEIKIEPIHRVDMVIDDPYSKSTDGGDAKQRALVDHIPEDEAEELYGEDVKSQREVDNACYGTAWSAPDNSVAVVTYYCLRKTQEALYLGEDGEQFKDEDVRANAAAKKKAKKARTIKKTVCDVYKIVGSKVVSKTTLPISYIPIVAVRGTQMMLDKKIDWVGLSYIARPVLKMLAYAISEGATRIAKAPRSLYTVDVASVAQFKELIASNAPFKFLPYTSVDPKNNNIRYNAPQLLNASVDVSDMVGLQLRCKEDLASILGMSEAGLLSGQKSNQTAAEVLTKQKSQDLSNYQYLDNAAESIKLIGRIVAQLIPAIIDTARQVPIASEQGYTMQEMDIPSMSIDPETFGIEVDSGPMSATTKKEELYKLLAVTEMMNDEQRAKAVPKVIRLSEIEGADEFAKMYEAPVGAGATDPMADEAIQQADQAISSLAEQMNQQNLYLQQLQGENAALKADNSATIYKANLDYKKAIDLELLKQQGDLSEMQLKIQADAEKALRDSEAAYMAVVAGKPEITVINGAAPNMPSIGGQRNDIFG